MKLYPAIDIKNGQCVRLRQGDFKQSEVYSLEPFKVAAKWEQAGASFLHVVDLDGALNGCGVNEETLKKIIDTVSIPVQVGGGIRSAADVERKLRLGVSRVILGTKAVENPELIKELIQRFGADKIVIGIDARDSMVAVKGWEVLSSRTAVSLALEMKKIGVKTIIYTDISKDGMMQGPNADRTKELMDASGLEIIASGGVSCMNDLYQLKEAGIKGAILGKALYEHSIDLAQAVQKIERESTI